MSVVELWCGRRRAYILYPFFSLIHHQRFVLFQTKLPYSQRSRPTRCQFVAMVYEFQQRRPGSNQITRDSREEKAIYCRVISPYRTMSAAERMDVIRDRT